MLSSTLCSSALLYFYGLVTIDATWIRNPFVKGSLNTYEADLFLTVEFFQPSTFSRFYFLTEPPQRRAAQDSFKIILMTLCILFLLWLSPEDVIKDDTFIRSPALMFLADIISSIDEVTLKAPWRCPYRMSAWNLRMWSLRKWKQEENSILFEHIYERKSMRHRARQNLSHLNGTSMECQWKALSNQ